MSYTSEAEIEDVVKGFEDCTTSKETFTHREHLTVAVWYLRHFSPEGALDHMRAGLMRFLTHHQVDPAKYKEGLTVAWMNLTGKTLAELPPNISLVEATNKVINQLGNSQLVQNREP